MVPPPSHSPSGVAKLPSFSLQDVTEGHSPYHPPNKKPVPLSCGWGGGEGVGEEGSWQQEVKRKAKKRVFCFFKAARGLGFGPLYLSHCLGAGGEKMVEEGGGGGVVGRRWDRYGQNNHFLLPLF